MSSNKKKTSEVLKGVAIGDLHLDKLVKMIPNINHIVINYCRTILDEAVEQGYDVAVFLGDIFNYMSASEEALKLFLELLVDYEDTGLAIRVIEGNHGYKRNGTGSLSMLAMLEDFNLLKSQLITEPRCEVIKGIPLVYLPHPYTCLQDLNRSYESLHDMLVESGLMDQMSFDQADSMGCDLSSCLINSIAFGHFTRAGSKADNGMSVESGVKYDPKLDAKHYIVGHLHTPQRNGVTDYPGTFYQTSFGEGEEKGYGKFIAQVTNQKTGEFNYKYKQVEVEPPIRLVNIIASKESQLPKKIQPNTWYKIQTINGFDLPEKYRQHKNVVESAPQILSTSKSNKSNDKLMDGNFELEKSLAEFLERDGLDESQIRVALKMTAKAMSQLGIEL